MRVRLRVKVWAKVGDTVRVKVKDKVRVRLRVKVRVRVDVGVGVGVGVRVRVRVSVTARVRVRVPAEMMCILRVPPMPGALRDLASCFSEILLANPAPARTRTTKYSLYCSFSPITLDANCESSRDGLHSVVRVRTLPLTTRSDDRLNPRACVSTGPSLPR